MGQMLPCIMMSYICMLHGSDAPGTSHRTHTRKVLPIASVGTVLISFDRC